MDYGEQHIQNQYLSDTKWKSAPPKVDSNSKAKKKLPHISEMKPLKTKIMKINQDIHIIIRTVTPLPM